MQRHRQHGTAALPGALPGAPQAPGPLPSPWRGRWTALRRLAGRPGAAAFAIVCRETVDLPAISTIPRRLPARNARYCRIAVQAIARRPRRSARCSGGSFVRKCARLTVSLFRSRFACPCEHLWAAPEAFPSHSVPLLLAASSHSPRQHSRPCLPLQLLGCRRWPLRASAPAGPARWQRCQRRRVALHPLAGTGRACSAFTGTFM